jgi:pyruvate-formate lyase
VVLTETWLYRYKGVELKFKEVQREIRKLINTAERGIVNNVEGKKDDLIKVSKLLEVVQATLETTEAIEAIETTETMKEESKSLAKVKIQSKKKKHK